jgi:hypothetical protein
MKMKNYYSHLQCCTSNDRITSERSYIGIDTMSTYCLTPNIGDFTGTTTTINTEVRGVSGMPTKVTKFGKESFELLDDS